jgi:hypothetical protein
MRRVTSPSEDRTGVLIVRAWLEGRPPAIRVRITSVLDVNESGDETRYAATVEGATRIVCEWLKDFEGSGESLR